METMVTMGNVKFSKIEEIKKKSFQTIPYHYTIMVIYTDIKPNSISGH